MGDYIFRSNPDGSIDYVGDFEGLYENEDNPWDQSDIDGSSLMSEYYRISRNNLASYISSLGRVDSIVEVGAGLGYLTSDLSSTLKKSAVYGCDISKRAVKRASSLHPALYFCQHNIVLSSLEKSAHLVLLSNLLWYILNDFEEVIRNAVKSLAFDGNNYAHIILHNAFFKSGQQYGKDKVSSLSDLLSLMLLSLQTLPDIQVAHVHAQLLEIPNGTYDEVLVHLRLKAV